MDPVEEIIRLIEEGKSNFTKWNWVQDFYCLKCRRELCLDGEDDPDVLDQSKGCEHLRADAKAYAKQVRKDASLAAEHADKAIEALRRKDFETAWDELWWAAGIESEYGDYPSYYPAVRALEDFRKELELEEEEDGEEEEDAG